mmetsp:Transcript_32518/g.82613  ORF Transcript_32518/g.82613 Transcript_32518/m.82613 type:complete len:232 (-) Transcript_32518:7-702(-)
MRLSSSWMSTVSEGSLAARDSSCTSASAHSAMRPLYRASEPGANAGCHAVRTARHAPSRSCTRPSSSSCAYCRGMSSTEGDRKGAWLGSLFITVRAASGSATTTKGRAPKKILNTGPYLAFHPSMAFCDPPARTISGMLPNSGAGRGPGMCLSLHASYAMQADCTSTAPPASAIGAAMTATGVHHGTDPIQEPPSDVDVMAKPPPVMEDHRWSTIPIASTGRLFHTNKFAG